MGIARSFFSSAFSEELGGIGSPSYGKKRSSQALTSTLLWCLLFCLTDFSLARVG